MAKVDVFLGVVAEEEAPDNSACSSKIIIRLCEHSAFLLLKPPLPSFLGIGP